VQNKTYSQLVSLIKSLAGVNSFTPEENGYILNFANRRLDEIYESSLMWPRYLRVGEERTISGDNRVPYSQADSSTIRDFISISREKPLVNKSVLSYDFYVNLNGANIINFNGSNSPSVYVTYKSGYYEFENDESSVPAEFFQYIAHASYADFLRMDGQIEKAILEEGIANDYMDRELGKLDTISNNNFVGRRIPTYVNSQSR
jgi:hypothetical protein